MNRHFAHKIQACLIGLFVIAAGISLYLLNAGIFPHHLKPILFSWQTLLAAIGCILVIDRHSWMGGAILILVGAIFLLPKLNLPGLDFSQGYGWALILVVVGFIILCKAIFGRKRCWHERRRSFRLDDRDDNCKPRDYKPGKRDWHGYEKRADSSGYLERNYVFSGGSDRSDCKNFKGGEVNCVFGEINLDLSEAQLAEGTHALEINTVFGGAVVTVPADWNIEVKRHEVFGRFSDRRPLAGFEVNENKKLVLVVTSVFGGGEIRCK